MRQAGRRCIAIHDGCVPSGADTPRDRPLKRSVLARAHSRPSAHGAALDSHALQEVQVVEHLVPIATAHCDVTRAASAFATTRAPPPRSPATRARGPVRRRPDRNQAAENATELLMVRDAQEDRRRLTRLWRVPRRARALVVSV